MASTVNIHEAKTHFSKLLARVSAGEEIVIARAGRPVAKLSKVKEEPKRRVLGMDKGRLWISPDFDAPLTDEELAEGEPDDLPHGPLMK